ncbi:MAG: glycosyltransferase [Bacillota bacterium]
MKSDGNSILVTILLGTYNSSKYIVDSLESIRTQTYSNVELVVSDDCSTDDTLEIVNKWLTTNKDRFRNVQIVCSSTNTGITKNCNRGFKLATGQYIKLIAGDDLLTPNCIENLLDFATVENADVVYGKVCPFYDCGINKHPVAGFFELKNHAIFKLNSRNQYLKLLEGETTIYAAGNFFSKMLIDEMNGFDEQYVMMEDFPFFVKITSMSYRIRHLDELVVMYRMRSMTDKNFLKSKRYLLWFNDINLFEKNELIPRLLAERKYVYLSDLYTRRFARLIRTKNNGSLAFILSRIIESLSLINIRTRIRMLFYYFGVR